MDFLRVIIGGSLLVLVHKRTFKRQHSMLACGCIVEDASPSLSKVTAHRTKASAHPHPGGAVGQRPLLEPAP